MLKWNDMAPPARSPGDPGKPERCGDVDRILPTIPILPISYADAEPFLRALGGDDVPSGWQGGLPFTYKIGPGRQPPLSKTTTADGLTRRGSLFKKKARRWSTSTFPWTKASTPCTVTPPHDEPFSPLHHCHACR